jgi:hypothetical protein
VAAATVENPEGFELDLRRVFAVLSMEVRRRMIGPIHPNDDPIEGRKTGHIALSAKPALPRPAGLLWDVRNRYAKLAITCLTSV